MLTWSSMPAEVGIDCSDAGTERRRSSATSAAAVYCATMNPEFIPGRGVRNGGRPEVCPFVSRSMRASAMSPSCATAIVARSRAIATGCPWKLPPERTRPSSGKTSGLSVIALISVSSTRRT